MKRKRRKNHESVDYWDSLADVMLALFQMILLIALLFILYFVQAVQNEAHVDDAPGANVATHEETGREDESAEHEEEFTEEEENEEEQDDDDTTIIINSSSGGGGRYDERRREQTPTALNGEEEDEGEKSAVLVKVVDAETLLPLAREGITFELYNSQNQIVTLNDYYPDKVEHSNYQTTKNGQFFLPEKIYLGDYILRGLNDVEGYEPAQDTVFTVDHYYDWKKPLEVSVRMYPLRSMIHINLVDKSSGDELNGGTFQVVAEENIATLDGTIRHKAGEVVDTVELDTNGNGDSKELYFGKYLLHQVQAPEFYGLNKDDVRVELKSKNTVTKTVQAEKTAIVVTLRDALYDDMTIPGAEFTVTGGGMTSSALVTDAEGQIVLTNLRKLTTYKIRQTRATSDYRMDDTEHSFTVDDSGLIQGEVRQEMTIENRMTRVSFRVSGTLMGQQVSDLRMALTNELGSAVEQWTTSGKDTLITGLEPGTYFLTIGSDLDHPKEIYITDEPAVQEFHFTHWTLLDTGIVLALVLFVGVALLIFLFMQRRRKRSQGGTSKP